MGIKKEITYKKLIRRLIILSLKLIIVSDRSELADEYALQMFQIMGLPEVLEVLEHVDND